MILGSNIKRKSNQWWKDDPLYNNPNVGVFYSIHDFGNDHPVNKFGEYISSSYSGTITSASRLSPVLSNEGGWKHSENDQPFEYPDGTKRWYHMGRYHRDINPAVIDNNGSEWFFNNGLLHRKDGPAIIRRPKEKITSVEWWLDGKNITEEMTQWMYDMDIIPWEHWGENDHVLFKLRFGGEQIER